MQVAIEDHQLALDSQCRQTGLLSSQPQDFKMRVRVYARTDTASSMRDTKTADIAIIAGCREGGSTKSVSKPGGGGIAGC